MVKYPATLPSQVYTQLMMLSLPCQATASGGLIQLLPFFSRRSGSLKFSWLFTFTKVTFSHDTYTFTQEWLLDTVHNTFFHLPDYTVHRTNLYAVEIIRFCSSRSFFVLLSLICSDFWLAKVFRSFSPFRLQAVSVAIVATSRSKMAPARWVLHRENSAAFLRR